MGRSVNTTETAPGGGQGLAEAPMSARLARFLRDENPPTPCLVVDLDVVAERYEHLHRALPEASIFYAVKANPEPDVLRLLVRLGSSFDVASPAEVDMCLRAGARPEQISYGNTIKKQDDIEYAYRKGVRLFAFDCPAELDKLAAAAPGASVFCRLLAGGEGADWPLSRKFGCDAEMAADLLVAAADVGLDPVGVSFHVGSQQRDPAQWGPAVARAAGVIREVVARTAGRVQLRMINLGGGFPARYLQEIPSIEAYGAAIRRAVADSFGPAAARLSLVVEPGRYIVGDAGVLHTEVVLVARKSYTDEERWVYLDTGVFGGLAETLGEAIKYRLVTSRDGGQTGPVVLAGPTCDSVDVLYEHYRYELPLDLTAGDRLAFLSAGAYTKAYATDGFNGFRPLPAYCLPPSDEA
jgi:ornithine decarboxylase